MSGPWQAVRKSAFPVMKLLYDLTSGLSGWLTGGLFCILADMLQLADPMILSGRKDDISERFAKDVSGCKTMY